MQRGFERNRRLRWNFCPVDFTPGAAVYSSRARIWGWQLLRTELLPSPGEMLSLWLGAASRKILVIF